MTVLTGNLLKEESVVGTIVTNKIVLVVEYNGTRYHGFQWQTGVPTVQGEIEEALWRLTGERRRVIAASRTDAGVHARGQVVSFRTDSSHSTETFVKGLNYYLPKDIAIKEAHHACDSLDIRRQAVSREYNYYILNSPTRSPLYEGFAHLVGARLDIDAMNGAGEALIGQHDLASFTSGDGPRLKNTVRTVYRAETRMDRELTIFNMVANSFLPYQVRTTVGTLIRVGLGKISQDEFCSIMDARKIGLAGPTAPPHGLCLMKINYDRPFEEEIC